MPGPGPVNCHIRHKDDGTIRCGTHGVEFTGPDVTAEVREHIRKMNEEWMREVAARFRRAARLLPEKESAGVRSEEEIRKALEFWKRAPTSTEEPKPIEVLIKGIVWTLEWVLGRDAGEIAGQASNETWFKRTVEETPMKDGGLETRGRRTRRAVWALERLQESLTRATTAVEGLTNALHKGGR